MEVALVVPDETLSVCTFVESPELEQPTHARAAAMESKILNFIAPNYYAAPRVARRKTLAAAFPATKFFA